MKTLVRNLKSSLFSSTQNLLLVTYHICAAENPWKSRLFSLLHVFSFTRCFFIFERFLAAGKAIEHGEKSNCSWQIWHARIPFTQVLIFYLIWNKFYQKSSKSIYFFTWIQVKIKFKIKKKCADFGLDLNYNFC